MSSVNALALSTTNLFSKNWKKKYRSLLNESKITSPLNAGGMVGQSWKSCTFALNSKVPRTLPEASTISIFAPTTV